ncbi:hypothetical protein [Vibrio phage JPW]|nr:hypothetical protein [Vibrio phage JPW]
MAYNGRPVCVFSTDPIKLAYARDWFEEEYDLKHVEGESGSTNFVIGGRKGWRDTVSYGHERKASDALEWMFKSDLLKGSGYVYPLFINLDEEVSDEYYSV